MSSNLSFKTQNTGDFIRYKMTAIPQVTIPAIFDSDSEHNAVEKELASLIDYGISLIAYRLSLIASSIIKTSNLVHVRRHQNSHAKQALLVDDAMDTLSEIMI